MDQLNEYQKKAAEYNGKHLLVLAGAGTGKTKTIIGRAKYLIKTGVQPHQIAILSFTRKSAMEIVERVKSGVSGHFNASGISGRTFHSWCNEIMHSFPDYFPQREFTLLDEDDRNSAMGLVVGRKFKDSRGEKLTSKQIVNIYSYAINTLCSLSEAIRVQRYQNIEKPQDQLDKIIEKDRMIIAPVIQQYIAYKRERKYLDYDDILNVVAHALQKNAIIRKAVSQRWQHILIDEMQDTNPLQYRLLESFVEDSHLFCVGDDAQSIYGFRGADFKNIHRFTEVIPDSDAYKLLLNYRSTQEILDLSNWLLRQSPLEYDKELKAFRGNGNKPKLIHTENDWEEANAVTEYILDKVRQENYQYADFMILGRSGWALSRVEGACLQKKIPYRKFGGTSLMQSAHVRDVAAAMRVVANNFDEIAWMRYLMLWPGIGEVTASRLIADILEMPNFDQIIEYLNLSNNKNLIKTIPATLQVIKDHIDHPARAMGEAVEKMEEILSVKYQENWESRVVDFEVLSEVAKSTGSITEFITEYVLDPKAEITLKSGREIIDDVVTLSTIHSAKGLEAKSVHVVGVNPYSYPSVRNIQEGEDSIEEERRCLYVALTRAKDELMVYRNTKSLHTQALDTGEPDSEQLNDRSLYFLNNLPIELVDIVVNGEENFRIEKDIEETDPADFPDFDFG